MFSRLTAVLLVAGLVAGCTGSFHLQRPIRGAEATAITVDARQRVLLSQVNPRAAATDPVFRRFCAEPSPDVFTVLGVAASGSLNFGLGADQSSSRALQGAFSSTETGATIARTQTINMLREMMFRTCERYLSGAISGDEFPIIAARDQRIMVSILAIEQLTGSITPRGVAITAGGNAGTGPGAETVRLLAEARQAVVNAQVTVDQKTTAQAAADTAAGTGGCAALKATVAAVVPPAPTPEQTNKINACNTAETNRNNAVVARDAAQEHYDTLVRASAGGLGATTSGTVREVGTTPERSQSVREVAEAVENIVANTFEQDETQLFCIRALNPASQGLSDPLLKENCMRYLVTQVDAERVQLARRYNLSEAAVRFNFGQGRGWADATAQRAQQLYLCAIDAARVARFDALVAASPVFDDNDAFTRAGFLREVKASASQAEEILRRAGQVREDRIVATLGPLCT